MFYCWGCGEVQKGVRLTLVARVKWYLFFFGVFLPDLFSFVESRCCVFQCQCKSKPTHVTVTVPLQLEKDVIKGQLAPIYTTVRKCVSCSGCNHYSFFVVAHFPLIPDPWEGTQLSPHIHSQTDADAHMYAHHKGMHACTHKVFLVIGPTAFQW